MLKLIFWFIVLAAAAAGLTWLAEHPGNMSLDWLGYHVESMPVALALGIVAAAMLVLWLVFRLVRLIISGPGLAVDFFRLRRRKKGLDELSGGLVALLAGDAQTARKAAGKAARLTPDEPVTRLLEARAAQQMGDDKAAKLLYLNMLKDEKTEPAALHGLYEQARREGDMAAARGWAERAWHKYPALPWAARAMLAFMAAEKNWPVVLDLIETQRKKGLLDKAAAQHLKAVALTAQAMDTEERDPQRAMEMAAQAHRFDPSLIPAAVMAGGMLAARGHLRKAARILEKTWKLAPHPDIAEVYAHLRPGDSPTDRLKRLKSLLKISSGGEEGAVALARAAIEARDWQTAREALRARLNDNPSSRIYQLMAEIEQEQSGDMGRAREWLARAVRARRNPAWTADGYVSPTWLPVSPITGELGTFEWKTPVSGSEQAAALEPVPADLLQPPAAPDKTAQQARDVTPETPAPEPEESQPHESGESSRAEAAKPASPEDLATQEETASEMATPAQQDKAAQATSQNKSPKPAAPSAAEPPEGSAAATVEPEIIAPAQPAPPPGAAPIAPHPMKMAKTPPAGKPGREESLDEAIITQPIPDDPGPKPGARPRKKGWFG